MRTVHCPKTHTELAKTCVGEPYGHVPGHHYHDVEVLISRRGSAYRCHVVESWGSCQGYDEEHGRREVIGRSESIAGAAAEALNAAKAAGINEKYLMSAITQAADDAEEAELDEDEE